MYLDVFQNYQPMVRRALPSSELIRDLVPGCAAVKPRASPRLASGVDSSDSVKDDGTPYPLEQALANGEPKRRPTIGLLDVSCFSASP